MTLLSDVTKRIPVGVVVVQGIIVVHQVTDSDMVDPRLQVVVLGRAFVKVRAEAPLPALVLAPNHHGGVSILALVPWRHLDSRMKPFAS